ncbi:MAG: YtxH domain-containing protein [Candidatus Dormiibacterota bacterium]
MRPEEPSPGERIAAFGVALQEELIHPLRRYLKGFRVGLLAGLVAAVLLTPWPGRLVRQRLLGLRARICRRRSGAGCA